MPRRRMLDFRRHCRVQTSQKRVCVMSFRSAVLATALVILSLPAVARGGRSDARAWRVLLPTVRATTDCIAQGIAASPIALNHARQGNWLEAVKSLQDKCSDIGRKLIVEHDRLHGPGTGKAFVEGPYASDLPRALKARIGPEMKRQAAQPVKAEEAPAPAATMAETPIQLPSPALLSGEPGQAGNVRLGEEELKEAALTVSTDAAVKQQTAVEPPAPPAPLRTAEGTAPKPR